MKSFYKLSGLILSIIGVIFGFIVSFKHQFGCMGADCVLDPRVTGSFIILSLVFLFVFIYSLIRDLSEIKKYTIQYLIILCVFSLFFFLFR